MLLVLLGVVLRRRAGAGARKFPRSDSIRTHAGGEQQTHLLMLMLTRLIMLSWLSSDLYAALVSSFQVGLSVMYDAAPLSPGSRGWTQMKASREVNWTHRSLLQGRAGQHSACPRIPLVKVKLKLIINAKIKGNEHH